MPRDTATRRSYEKLIEARPVFGRIARLADLMPGLPERTLFHAGPPFASLGSAPAPVMNAAAAAATHEGWAGTRETALAQLAAGAIRLAPAQDVGLVTPLAFVVAPRVFCLEITDAARPDLRRLAPLNDGPPPAALRFGTARPEGLALLQRLDAAVGPDLALNAPTGAPMLPLLAEALSRGDDLHGHVAAAQEAFLALLGDDIETETLAYMREANQFVLNVIMATAALMLAAAAGIEESNLVVAAGGNGVDFGVKRASSPDTWITHPATTPQGTRLPGRDGAAALPAIGDSAVIDALGFGAACLRFCPTLSDALEARVDPGYLTPAAHDPYIGPHPAFPDASLRVGLDLTRPRTCLGIMLGMVEAGGTEGLIGRGIAPWP